MVKCTVNMCKYIQEVCPTMSETRLKSAPKTGLQKLLFDNRFCYLAFVCSALIMTLVFYCFDMVPFGDVTILRMDLYHQYGPLFAELYERIKNGDSLLYSWNTGMGGSFLGNFFNYLASPLLVVMFLFSHVNVPVAIALMVLLKASFASAFFTYYLRKSQNRNDHVTSAFGVLYSFCGFFIAYYWNIMWLDAMMLFPLVILGIERIIDKKGFLLYTIVLTVIMISNYYMALMVCMFSVLYFFVRYFSCYAFADKLDAHKRKFSVSNQRILNTGFTFAGASVLAALLALFALLPTVFILRACSATSGSFPQDYRSYYSVFDFLANHLASVEPTIRSSGEDVLPNVYCGILTVMLVPLYLLSKSIKLKEKIMHVLLLGVLYFSFNINYANYVWHGFHFPNDLPYRFSFMYSFILLILAFRAICRIREFSGKELLMTGVGVLFFIVLVQKIGSKNVDETSVLISLAFTFLYTLVLAAMHNRKFQAASVSLLLLCCVISESAIANTDNYSMNQTKAAYTGDYDEFTVVKQRLDDYHGDKMYRMELANLRTRMDPAWYNYHGLSTFSSMASEKLSNLQSHLGIYGNYINSYTYHPQTPVYNAMMALNYVVKKNDAVWFENEELYAPCVSSTLYEAYENRYALPIAFAVGSSVENWNDSESNPFAVQSDFLRRASGIQGMFTPMAVTYVYTNNVSNVTKDTVLNNHIEFSKIDGSSYGSFTVTISPFVRQNCYLYVKSRSVDTLYVNGNDINLTQDIDEAYILDLGVLDAYEEVDVEIPIKDDSSSGSVDFYACGLDMDVFRKAYNELEKGAMQISTFEETHIEGTITVEPNQILYTSIPYDDGWKIYVDGKKVDRKDYLKIGQALLGIRIEAGEHTIVMDYEPVGLRPAAFVSCTTLVLFVLGLLIARRRKQKFYAPVQTPALVSIEETPSFDNEAEPPCTPNDEIGDERFAFVEEIPEDEPQPEQKGE